MLKTDQIIIVGDFNIHVDVDRDSLSCAFNSLLESIGFIQHVNKPTHCLSHTLDLVLTYGIDIDNLNIVPQNPLLTDHYLLTFNCTIMNYNNINKKYRYTRCLSDNNMNTFKETVQPLFNSVPYVSTSEGTFCDCTPALIDNLVDSTAASLRTTLDCVAPLKKKVVNQMRRTPWFNSDTCALKQTLRRLERKWRSNNLEEFYIAWKDGFVAYKKALHKARVAYYSSLIEENKNNHRFLFSTVARLTQSHSSTEPSIPLTLSSDDFMNFFVNKITSIREKIDHLLPHIGTDSSFSTRALEAPGAQLDSFSPIDLPELTSLVSSSKPSTCQLDPIPTKLFKDVFPLINSSILTQINLSLLTGYVPHTFKIAVIKPLLKKATLDPDILANYRPISNLPFCF